MMNHDIIYIDSITSTNDYIASLPLKKDTVLLVYTDYQYKGKGQMGNKWESEKGKNLLFSIKYAPKRITINNSFILSMLGALAICKTLRENFHKDFRIKWPNDIYIDDKKICGILVETTIKSNIIKEFIFGVGLNVNQKIFLSDAPNPVSLYTILNREIDRKKLLHCIYSTFNYFISSFEQDNIGFSKIIIEEYHSLLYRKKGYYKYKDKTGEFMAEIERVLTNGHLILKTEEREKLTFAFKEVEYII